jgi:hypothetical protein
MPRKGSRPLSAFGLIKGQSMTLSGAGPNHTSKLIRLTQNETGAPAAFESLLGRSSRKGKLSAPGSISATATEKKTTSNLVDSSSVLVTRSGVLITGTLPD